MYLFKSNKSSGKQNAIIADLPQHAVPAGVASAAFETMSFIATAKDKHAFWNLLKKAADDPSIENIAISLNDKCVFDDELPSRISSACASAAGGAKWAVLASTGKCINGMTCSVVYPSATPRLLTHSIPQPIVDCGLDLFVLNSEFLKKHFYTLKELLVEPNDFAQWCILTGYENDYISVFRPELAIGINGSERGCDLNKRVDMIKNNFYGSFVNGSIPSLMGNIPVIEPEEVEINKRKSVREKAICRPTVSLEDAIYRTSIKLSTPMSISIITRTQFSRDYLLRRMLSSLTRARHDGKVEVEVVLTTDIESAKAKVAYNDIKRDFPELDITLQVNNGIYPHSRVDNLVGGINNAKHDYIVIIDDDDFIDLDGIKSISNARFLDNDPLVIMSSQVRNEEWKQAGNDRWILEKSEPAETYYSDNFSYMFSGVNQLPVCAIVAPREWVKDRLANLALRHDLSEDYIIYLALLCSPDLPPILTYTDIFCMISSRNDGTNTITMKDRRPWVRDITLFLHDLFINNKIPGMTSSQVLAQVARLPPKTAINYMSESSSVGSARRDREISMLKGEIKHLQNMLSNEKMES